MDLSKIKMVVSDMDGTLLNSTHHVSERFFKVFEILKSKGVLFVAASGRQYNSIIDKLHPIKDDIVVIAENGGFVMQQEKEFLSTPLPTNHIKKTLEILRKFPEMHPVLCGKQTAYITGKSAIFTDKLREYYTAFDVVDTLENVSTEIIKIAIYHFESSERFIYPHVKHLEQELKVKISGTNWVDISSANAHKGFALEKVMKAHHINSDEVLVFGDYNNDLEMLALSDFSFAMENAHLNVKNTAKYQTVSNDNFGVEVVLEKLISQLK
ncbi:MAG: Cof subfamily protein (haloacid dehalogenase superfamily) [Maribacter sp.]|jgi:Cof subfamily protein (haloacid dehalogenase superfamily)